MHAIMYMLSIEQLVLVRESYSIQETLERMKQGSYKTLPVIDEESRFVGVIQESKLFETFFYHEGCQKKLMESEIRPLVNRRVKAVAKNTDFMEVILKMQEMDIHFLPIVAHEHRFIGIVTRNKILEAFKSAFGYNRDGYLVEVVAIDAKGQLARLANTIAATGANIVSIILFDQSVANLERIMVKVQTENIKKVIENISKEGFRIITHRFIPKVQRDA